MEMNGKPVIEIMLVVYGADKEGTIIANKVFDVIIDHISIETRGSVALAGTIHDVITHGDLDTDKPCIAFGAGAESNTKTSSKLWLMPLVSALVPSDDNVDSRKEGLKLIKDMGPELDKVILEIVAKVEEEPTETFVEKDGVTIGKAGVNIEITEEEAKYLKRIKDLLGGGKMVITKGDLRIETE